MGEATAPCLDVCVSVCWLSILLVQRQLASKVDRSQTQGMKCIIPRSHHPRFPTMSLVIHSAGYVLRTILVQYEYNCTQDMKLLLTISSSGLLIRPLLRLCVRYDRCSVPQFHQLSLSSSRILLSAVIS